jgi:hypothetical protein
MKLELLIYAVQEGFRVMLVELMGFVFGSAGSGFVVSCVVSCRRVGVEVWMGSSPGR